MKYLAHVNPKYFAAMELFIGRLDVRYYLNGVRIEPHPIKGAILVATDGHTMAVIHDPDGWCAEGIIVGDISKALIAACKRQGARRKLFTKPEKLWICDGGAVVMASADATPPDSPFNPRSLHTSRIEIIDGKYPDWLSVVPAERKTRKGPLPLVNPDYLVRMHNALAILAERSKTRHAALSLEAHDGTGMVVVRTGELELGERFVGLIMSMHGEPPAMLLPDWLLGPVKAAKKARIARTKAASKTTQGKAVPA